MAILTGITGAVRANIAGYANKAIRASSNQIKSIVGLPVEGSTSALDNIINLSKRNSTKILTYPINVDTDSHQGHYILFEINKRIDGKLAKIKIKKILVKL